MVRKVHEYANGGQVDDSTDTKYRWPKPSYIEAVVDRTKELRDRAAANWRALKGALTPDEPTPRKPRHDGEDYDEIVDKKAQ